jgi:hypothetical protein
LFLSAESLLLFVLPRTALAALEAATVLLVLTRPVPLGCRDELAPLDDAEIPDTEPGVDV